MTITLEAADAAKFSAGGDWKDGFIRALIDSVPNEQTMVIVEDPAHGVLAKYLRDWKQVP